MLFTLAEVTRLTGARVVRWPHGDGPVQPVHRIGAAGPGALFFPMRRSPAGAPLFSALAGAGAHGVVLFAGQEPPDPQRYPGLGALALPWPPDGFFRLAGAARARAGALVAGVTGSAGKSSTKEYLATLLRSRYRRVHATVNSRNRLSDLAGILLGLEGGGGEAAVIEMGFCRAGDIERMAALAQPFAGIITNITPNHLDGTRGSWEALVREKGRLGHHLPPDGLLALHAGDPGCDRLPRREYRSRIFTFGPGAGADVGYEAVQADECGTGLVLRLFGQRIPCRLQAYGPVQAANAAAAALVAHVLGVPAAEIQEGLAQTPPLPRRFAIHRFRHGLTVIDDTFSASVDATLRGLSAAAALAGSRRRVALLSGLFQLWDRTAAYHRLIGAHVVACGFSELFLYGRRQTASIREGAVHAGMDPARIHPVGSRAEIPERLLPLAQPDTLIYCKASQTAWIGPAIDAFRAAVAAAGFTPLSPEKEA